MLFIYIYLWEAISKNENMTKYTFCAMNKSDINYSLKQDI